MNFSLTPERALLRCLFAWFSLLNFLAGLLLLHLLLSWSCQFPLNFSPVWSPLFPTMPLGLLWSKYRHSPRAEQGSSLFLRTDSPPSRTSVSQHQSWSGANSPLLHSDALAEPVGCWVETAAPGHLGSVELLPSWPAGVGAIRAQYSRPAVPDAHGPASQRRLREGRKPSSLGHTCLA